MRRLGVTGLRVDGAELHLGPEPPKVETLTRSIQEADTDEERRKLAGELQTEKQRAARARRIADIRLMLASSMPGLSDEEIEKKFLGGSAS